MTRIFIVRHGQTYYNALKLYQGQLDTPLNEVGLKQARELKERVLKSGLHIDEIWSSDLQRTRATVAPIAEVLSIPMHLHAGLREIHVGIFTDKTTELVKQIYKKEYDDIAQKGKNAVYPDGESLEQVRKRIYSTVCDIGEKTTEKLCF